MGKRLAFIKTCVRDFAESGRIEFDVRERRFVKHTLQIAIQEIRLTNIESFVASIRRRFDYVSAG